MSFTEKELWALRGRLMSYARTLSHSDYEELVQDAMVRAWRARESFIPGTNLIGWVTTILRNVFLSGLRKRKREVELPEDDSIERLAIINPSQEDALYLQQVHEYMEYLPMEQHRALMLTHVNGWSYEEVAQHDCVPIGTIKSRVNRALEKLKQLLADGLPLTPASPRTADVPTLPIRVIGIAKPAIPLPLLAAPITVPPKIVTPVSIPRPAITMSARSIQFIPITTEAMYGSFRIRSTVLRRIQ